MSMFVYTWLKRILLFSFLLYVFYQAGPSIAAVFKIGDSQGPVIYNEERHIKQYNMTYETIHGSEARLSIVTVLSDRPYFYGLDRRPKPKEERERMIKKMDDLSYPLKKQLRETHAAMGD